MSDIFDTLRFTGYSETGYKTTAAVLRSERGDGKKLFGRHGEALADFIDLFLTQTDLPKSAEVKTKEVEKLSDEELEAKELITHMQGVYKERLGFVWDRKTPAVHRAEQKVIAGLLKKYGRDRLLSAWDTYISAGTKLDTDRAYQYLFRDGDIKSFRNSISRLLAHSSPQQQSVSAVPSSFRAAS